MLNAIGPDLAAALNNKNNQEMLVAIAEAISPYALAEGTPVSDAVSKMLRGTTLESVLGALNKNTEQ